MRMIRMAAVFVAWAIAGTAAAAGEAITVELNRLDAQGDDCRIHVVLSNDSKETYSGFALDLVIFDREQRIARRTAVDVAPVRATKTTVYAFDVKGLACNAIGSVLLNDVVDCAASKGAMTDCVTGVGVTSKTEIAFRK